MEQMKKLLTVGLAFAIGIVSYTAYDRWAWQAYYNDRATSYPVEYVQQQVQSCYLDALNRTQDPDHGSIWQGTCDNGLQIIIVEHD